MKDRIAAAVICIFTVTIFIHEASANNAAIPYQQTKPTYKRKKAPARGAFYLLHHADYLAFISATVVSSMRFEKPHSLSYHDDTFTRRPDTLVRVESKFDEAGLWLKSIDTSGSV